ncbi:MAG: stage 0 sporulation family protein [Pygmaiobacter massiliensis]|nr:stage 0 sporulation family protein [Pygmaiobacter massiliensis]
MVNVVGVRFKTGGKVYYFDPCGLILRKGDYVIVETARGLECGEVCQPVHAVADVSITKALKQVVRVADDVDVRRMRQNREDEKRAFQICEERISRHKLEMKLIDVEYAFDRSKILFNFTADGRVDFRELVKDLAGVFRTRIELRQIGVRDESKMLGGLGICGQPFCCSRFLSDFQPVSIKMAKEQGLSLNPTKISGSCGRLMCCLAYEQPAYEYLNSITPGVGSYVKTPDGEGTVCEANPVSGQVKVRLEPGVDVPKTYIRDELEVLRAASKRAGEKKRRKAARTPKPAEPAQNMQKTPGAHSVGDRAHAAGQGKENAVRKQPEKSS